MLVDELPRTAAEKIAENALRDRGAGPDADAVARMW